jgi:hypothetical protein
MRPAEADVGPERMRSILDPPGEEAHCVSCGFPVPERPLGCKGPCPNCGFLYPRGDCSD